MKFLTGSALDTSKTCPKAGSKRSQRGPFRYAFPISTENGRQWIIIVPTRAVRSARGRSKRAPTGIAGSAVLGMAGIFIPSPGRLPVAMRIVAKRFIRSRSVMTKFSSVWNPNRHIPARSPTLWPRPWSIGASNGFSASSGTPISDYRMPFVDVSWTVRSAISAFATKEPRLLPHRLTEN